MITDPSRRDFFNHWRIRPRRLSSRLSYEWRSQCCSCAGSFGNSHFPGKAKRCIMVYMAGAPSQLDLFDHKPKLNELDGQSLPDSLLEGKQFAFIKKETAKLMGSKAEFKRHGQSRACISHNTYPILPNTLMTSA